MITLAGTPTLETERLILRAPRAADAAAYIAHFGSERAKYAGGQKGLRDAWDFFASITGHWVLRGYGMFTVTSKDDETPLGMVGHWFPETRPETEIGWTVFEGSEGKGIAFEAAQACIAHGWNVLGWDRMVSYIHPDNARSIALAQRLGATVDPDAAPAKPDVPCVVYRHARPA